MVTLLERGRQTVLGRAALVVLLVLSLSVSVLGIHALVTASSLQRTLDRERALQIVRGAIEERLASDGAGSLQTFLRSSVDRGSLGLRYVVVRAPGGMVVAEAGVHDSLRVPMISPIYTERLRENLHRMSGDVGQFAITRDGRTLATVEYIIAGGTLPTVRDDAVRSLRLSGVFALLFGLPLLGLLVVFGLRNPAPAPQQFAHRLGVSPRHSGELNAESDNTGALEGRTAKALDRLNRGVVIVDRDIRVRHINAVAEALTGWRREDAVGRLVYSVFHPLADDEQPLTTPAETAVREGGETPTTECRLRARNGEVRPVEVMAAVLRDSDGVVDGAVMFFHDVSHRAEAVEGLRRQARLTQGVIDHLVEGVLTTDPAGVIRFANARALRMFGYGKDELQGATITKLMPVPFLNSPGITLRDYVSATARPRMPRVVGWRKDATTFPIELLVEPMKQDEEEGLVVIVRDISDRLRGDNLTLRLGRLLDNAAEEIFIFDAQSLYFTEVNRGARRNLGLRPEQLARMTPLSLGDGLDEEQFYEYLAKLRSGDVEHLSYRTSHRRADGSTYPVEVRLSYSREEEPPVFMAVATDITDREAAEARLAHLASHDSLTGLPNRPALMAQLNEALTAAARSGGAVGVLFVDLDFFKRVNDTHGHDAGDTLLRRVAERFAAVVGDRAHLGRLSGDEFIVIAPGMGDRESAEALAGQVLDSLRLPVQVGLHGLSVSASIGIAIHNALDEDPVDASVLLSRADRAMYAAKKSGRGRYWLYQPSLDDARGGVTPIRQF
jgi:diguanylate cyclase (GGDEF)-like protein/PAS domain S-box-containing protein